MVSDFVDAIKQIRQDKGIPESLICSAVEELLLAACKKKFGTADNAVVKMSEDHKSFLVYVRKKIVKSEDLVNPALEISLEEALRYNEECETGDELLIEVNPASFDRGAVQSARQRVRQALREMQKDVLYSEFKDKVGEIIIGYCQRERNGTIFVDLGKTEGILPKNHQSPREFYHPGDRIKTLITEVTKTPAGLRIILSRTDTDFVKRIFELEVPEVYEETVEIVRIVREPGYRTKVAVASHREDVDPVGACVGFKGIRVQAIVRELEGEKIDLLRYDTDPSAFIKNALSPAQVSDVIVLDATKRQALAVVKEDQLSLSIGKQGFNVRLANRLVDWSIDVKTEEQVVEMDLLPSVSSLFTEDQKSFSSLEGKPVAELPNLSERVVEILQANGIDLVETLVNLEREDLEKFEGLTEEDQQIVWQVISSAREVKLPQEVPSQPSEEGATEEVEVDGLLEEEVYECPECHAPSITTSMTACPSCGVELSFEFEEIEENE